MAGTTVFIDSDGTVWIEKLTIHGRPDARVDNLGKETNPDQPDGKPTGASDKIYTWLLANTTPKVMENLRKKFEKFAVKIPESRGGQ